MPKNTFAPKAPIEKLPLAVRKDLRDNYENKREDWESDLTTILGTTVKLNFNANAVWPYAETSGQTACGGTLAGYAEGFVYAAKSFAENYGDLGKDYFKNAVTTGEVTLEVNELGDNADAIAADVKDGVFRILFHQGRFGYNQSWLNDPFVKALDEAPHPQSPYGLYAKKSIETEYNEKIEDTQEEIGKILNMSDVVLDPNFEENYEKLSKAKKDDKDWQKTFGRASYEYFQDGVRYQLKSQGFESDDMLQEGFAEAVTSKTIKLRIVDKTKDGYAQASLEDGTLFISVQPDRWWYNMSDAGSKIIDLL